jgi:hypothetical protein
MALYQRGRIWYADLMFKASGFRRAPERHANITTTVRYAHSNRDAKKRAVRLLRKGSDKTVTVAQSEKQFA